MTIAERYEQANEHHIVGVASNLAAEYPDANIEVVVAASKLLDNWALMPHSGSDEDLEDLKMIVTLDG